jgi:hypothetical protein
MPEAKALDDLGTPQGLQKLNAYDNTRLNQ